MTTRTQQVTRLRPRQHSSLVARSPACGHHRNNLLVALFSITLAIGHRAELAHSGLVPATGSQASAGWQPAQYYQQGPSDHGRYFGQSPLGGGPPQQMGPPGARDQPPAYYSPQGRQTNRENYPTDQAVAPPRGHAPANNFGYAPVPVPIPQFAPQPPQPRQKFKPSKEDPCGAVSN